MEIMDLLDNTALMAALLAWFIAQVIKVVLVFFEERRFDLAKMISSGGMPSSHSATVSALVVSSAKMCGIASPEFALAFILAFIVMYDAAGVRRAAGEQAKVLNKIVHDISLGDTKYLDKNLKELIGHTPLQVIMGALLGIAIGVFMPVF